MKVVLFCGGFGMRIREHADSTPKPMVNIGYQPILWHVMKYYAHYGHKDFILCLGYKADEIKRYFLNYNECMSNDFVISEGGQRVKLLQSDIQDWNITLVDTGTSANIGQRLQAVRPYLEGEDVFLANYTDGLSDLRLPDLIDLRQRKKAVAAFLSVRPPHTFHAVEAAGDGMVSRVSPITRSPIWINGGFFVMTPEIFNAMKPGDDLVNGPFDRLIAKQKLATLKYEGFWSCMDTYKEKQSLDEMVTRGETPWAVWDRPSGQSARRAPGVLAANANGNGNHCRPWGANGGATHDAGTPS